MLTKTWDVGVPFKGTLGTSGKNGKQQDSAYPDQMEHPFDDEGLDDIKFKIFRINRK